MPVAAANAPGYGPSRSSRRYATSGCTVGAGQYAGQVDVEVLGGWPVPGHPGYEFAEGGMDGDPVEMDNCRVGLRGAVAVHPVEGLLLRGLRPPADFGWVQLAQAVETGSAGDDEHRAAADGWPRGGGVDARGDVDVGRRGVDGNLVEAVARPVVVDATDDEVDVVEFWMGADGAERGQGCDTQPGVDLAHASPGDEVLGSANIGVAGCGCRKPTPPGDIRESRPQRDRAAGRGSGLGR